MKARYLKKLLNDTGYTIADYGKYIAVGSHLCHDLIKVEKDTLRLSYALDGFKRGREALDHKDVLLSIWDKLQSLIDSGEIRDIIEGFDTIENPLPVFYIRDGKLVESHTDEYGYPNTTFDGVMMYNNTHFKTNQEAIDYGISELNHEIKFRAEQINRLVSEIQSHRDAIDACKTNIGTLLRAKSNATA